MAAWRSNPKAKQHTPNGPSVKMVSIEHPKQERPSSKNLHGKDLYRKVRKVLRLMKTDHFALVAGRELPKDQFTYRHKDGTKFNRYHASRFAQEALKKAKRSV